MPDYAPGFAQHLQPLVKLSISASRGLGVGAEQTCGLYLSHFIV